MPLLDRKVRIGPLPVMTVDQDILEALADANLPAPDIDREDTIATLTFADSGPARHLWVTSGPRQPATLFVRNVPMQLFIATGRVHFQPQRTNQCRNCGQAGHRDTECTQFQPVDDTDTQQGEHARDARGYNRSASRGRRSTSRQRGTSRSRRSASQASSTPSRTNQRGKSPRRRFPTRTTWPAPAPTRQHPGAAAAESALAVREAVANAVEREISAIINPLRNDQVALHREQVACTQAVANAFNTLDARLLAERQQRDADRQRYEATLLALQQRQEEERERQAQEHAATIQRMEQQETVTASIAARIPGLEDDLRSLVTTLGAISTRLSTIPSEAPRAPPPPPTKKDPPSN
jgi:hypothetical protein